MIKFIHLQDLYEQIWSLAVAQNLATDMTGVSLPILDFNKNDTNHPYQVIFLLYYSVPEEANSEEPNQITSPYALIKVDLKTGALLEAKAIRGENEPNPLIGNSARKEVSILPDNDRRILQEMLFSRFDEAAQVYFSGEITDEQAIHLADLLKLFEYISEPPLQPDYESFGNEFLTWLRTNAKKEIIK